MRIIFISFLLLFFCSSAALSFYSKVTLYNYTPKQLSLTTDISGCGPASGSYPAVANPMSNGKPGIGSYSVEDGLFCGHQRNIWVIFQYRTACKNSPDNLICSNIDPDTDYFNLTDGSEFSLIVTGSCHTGFTCTCSVTKDGSPKGSCPK